MDLVTTSNSGGTYKILVYAKSLGKEGTEAHGSQAIYYVNVGHRVTVDDGSDTEPVSSHYASGESVTISAKPDEDAYFERWTVQLVDEDGEAVEGDIADEILDGHQTDADVTFTMPEVGDEYAKGQKYPTGHGLYLKAICKSKVEGIMVDEAENERDLVPVAGDDNRLAGALELWMISEGVPWEPWLNPYEISWTYTYEGVTYAADPGDVIFGHSVYTATIVAPEEYVDPEEETTTHRTIAYAPKLSVSAVEDLDGTYTSLTVATDDEGSAVITITFNETGDGQVPIPVMNYLLRLVGVDASDAEEHMEELGVSGYAKAKSELNVTAKAWPGYRFVSWTFTAPYRDGYIDPVMGEDLKNRTIKVVTHEDVPVEHGDTFTLYALYKPVVSEMAAVVEAPVGGKAMQTKPVDTEGKETLKIKLADEWYVVHPDYIDTVDGAGSITWFPDPLPGGKADYRQSYRADLRIVAKTVGDRDYIEVKKEGSDEYVSRSADFAYADNPKVTMNGDAASFDADTQALYYQFPKTTSVLKKVFPPSDVTGIPYGTAQEELGSYLPTMVNILLEGGTTMIASVEWEEPYPQHDFICRLSQSRRQTNREGANPADKTAAGRRALTPQHRPRGPIRMPPSIESPGSVGGFPCC